jgi:16S rRNA (uracil1498-N3)-methyltransferase
MRRFFLKHIPENQSFELPEEESKHMIRVLRMNVGDTCVLLDGKGQLVEVEINDAHPKRCGVTVLSREQKTRSSEFHLAIAPTKNSDRMEWMVEKCTEFGIHSISFFHSRFSERKEIKLNRLEKVAISALKQSKNLHLPQFHSIQPIKDLIHLNLDNDKTQKLFAYITPDPVESLIKSLELHQSYYIMIGPEGDFSSEESQQLIKNNWQPFHLGKSILRTETAGIASTLAVHLFHESNN